MIQLQKIFEHKANERVYHVARQHSAVLMTKLICAGILLVVPFFFLFFLTQWKTVGIILFAIVEAVGLLWTIRAFVSWDGTVLVLTSHRICQVHQNGLWKRRVIDTPFVFVQGVRYERAGMGDALLGTGTLHVQTHGSEATVIAPWMAKPEKLQAIIHELREKRAWQQEVPSVPLVVDQREMNKEAARERVQNLLQGVDEETLRVVEQLLQNRKS